MQAYCGAAYGTFWHGAAAFVPRSIFVSGTDGHVSVDTSIDLTSPRPRPDAAPDLPVASPSTSAAFFGVAFLRSNSVVIASVRNPAAN